jgi:hypothetical protein
MRTDHGTGSQAPHHLQRFPHSEGEEVPALHYGGGSQEKRISTGMSSQASLSACVSRQSATGRSKSGRLGCVWVGLGIVPRRYAPGARNVTSESSSCEFRRTLGYSTSPVHRYKTNPILGCYYGIPLDTACPCVLCSATSFAVGEPQGKTLRSDCRKGGNALPNLGRHGPCSIVSHPCPTCVGLCTMLCYIDPLYTGGRLAHTLSLQQIW